MSLISIHDNFSAREKSEFVQSPTSDTETQKVQYLWGPHGRRRRGHRTQSWHQQASICGVLMGTEEEGTVLNPGTNRQVSVGSSWVPKRRAPYSILVPTGKYLWGPHGCRRRGHRTQSWYQTVPSSSAPMRTPQILACWYQD